MSLPDTYAQRVAQLLERARQQNATALKKAGAVIGESIAAGGVLHTFGSGHSEIIAREIIGRAGGLVCVSGIYDATGGFIENLVGYGTKLAERYDRAHGLRGGEAIIVISNSGKNSSPIEVALYAKQKGMTVIALTSVEMARQSATVHPGGKKLHELADLVLDNCGTVGDALVDVVGGPAAPEIVAKAGPTSTLAGALLLNLLSLEVTEWLAARGHTPPILRSQNLPGAIEYNRELAVRYRGRLSRQLA
ncbi:MAG TPA: sugar isomerase domain-containing protein [Opitutaceae bacterium]|nr:sugar isomerase domain-containing protein [Opitutaceae bacterium]